MHQKSDFLCLLEGLTKEGKSHYAGRLAGALRAIGRDELAEEVLGAMRAAGYAPPESNWRHVATGSRT